jgi:uncharacterized protein YjdB
VVVTSVSLNKTSATLGVGDVDQLTATVLPTTATDKTVTWSSSNTAVATVSSSGLVTAHSRGTATITVTSADNAGLTVSCNITVAGSVVYVGNACNSGTGSLRQAITNAYSDDVIRFNPAANWADSTIVLASSLLDITKNLTIEGNGVKISGNNSYRILYIANGGYTVNISRVHFTNGYINDGGGAIVNTGGNLTLQSCIFSNNNVGTSNYGGAVISHSTGAVLTVKGCTFYSNSAHYGGAIVVYTGTATLTGNLFYGNTGSSGNTVYRSSATVTSSYNVYDNSSYNFTFNGTGDKSISSVPFSTTTFIPTASSGALNVLPVTLSAGYPAEDFYGRIISGNGAAGAVQVIVDVSGVSLNKAFSTLDINGTEQLTATVAPTNASNKNVTWSSSNTAVATVSSTGLVTAISDGTADITVITEDGGYTDVCIVTVIIPVTGVSLNKTSTTISVGSTETLTATIAPSNATNQAVAWSSSNTSAATVSSTGRVTAVSAGTATITVTTQDGSRTATCAVTNNLFGYVLEYCVSISFT